MSSSEDSTDGDLSSLVCLEDLEHLAEKKLDRARFNYIQHGDEGSTYSSNQKLIVDKYILRPRILRNVSDIDTTKYIFGDKISLPIGIGPTGLHKLFNDQGELGTVRAASKHNALMILSQFSTTSLEDVAREAPVCTKWQNIYLLKNRALTQSVINRAIRYGYRALVVTCKSISPDRKRKKIYNDLSLDTSDHQLKVFSPDDQRPNISSIYESTNSNSIFDNSITWQDLADLKKNLGDTIRVIIKGIMTPEDAEQAIAAGVDGIYVSNHSGSTLDCYQSTLEALSPVVKVVKSRIPVFVDGGFHRGCDVLKALALGADMVFLGPPILNGLAVGGEAGVDLALGLIRDELIRCMELCGFRNLQEIDERCIMDRLNDNPFSYRKGSTSKSE